jgi:hypothetical protein
MNKRANFMDDDTSSPPTISLDVSGFAPKSPSSPSLREQASAVANQVAASHRFPSREARDETSAPVGRRQRRHTTGRNQQLNTKATADYIKLFQNLQDLLSQKSGRDVPQAEAFERAVDALARELGYPTESKE